MLRMHFDIWFSFLQFKKGLTYIFVNGGYFSKTQIKAQGSLIAFIGRPQRSLIFAKINIISCGFEVLIAHLSELCRTDYFFLFLLALTRTWLPGLAFRVLRGLVLIAVGWLGLCLLGFRTVGSWNYLSEILWFAHLIGTYILHRYFGVAIWALAILEVVGFHIIPIKFILVEFLVIYLIIIHRTWASHFLPLLFVCLIKVIVYLLLFYFAWKKFGQDSITYPKSCCFW